MELIEILKLAVQYRASDIHLKAGQPPIFRIDGGLKYLKGGERMTQEDLSSAAFDIMNPRQEEMFEKFSEIDIPHKIQDVGRFRVNIYKQRGMIGIAFRVIPFKVPTIDELNLPSSLKKIAMEQRGLVLVTGTTGAGKSTTLAGMIEHINTNRMCNIVTIEDPIEYNILDKSSIISQREIGTDTTSFARALRAALRQDPDVILVGEMRDLETIETALLAAETGHLVMSTLHTTDATETIQRVVAVFPPHQQQQVRLQLGSVLKAVVSQRLVPKAEGVGVVPAVEILRNTSRIRELIEDKERTKEIYDAISSGYVSYGMQTFDQSLMALLKENLITYDEALKQSTTPDDFALRLKGVASTSDSRWEEFEKAK
jgi:twitching motility protein PilT